MTYATVDNVKSMFRKLAGTSKAAITDAEIQEFLDDATLTLDARIGTLYTLPLTVLDNPKSYALMAKMEKYLAADVVDSILNNYSSDKLKPDWGKKAMKELEVYAPSLNNKGIQPEPIAKLPDAVYTGTSGQRGRVSGASTTSPTFTKAGDNW